MKIVFANRYFYPDQSATSRMVSSLAFALAEKGFSVTAIASRHYQDRREASLPAREVVRGVNIERLWTSGFGRAGMAGRAVDYGTFHASAMLWFSAKARPGDLCVVCTDPPLLSVSSALPIALRRARLVNWVMDLFPETASELRVLAGSGRLQSMMTMLRDGSLKMADRTICPIPAMADHLRQRLPNADFATVRHWSDGDEIRPVPRDRNRLRKEWGLEHAFVVGYSGNFGRAHEFGTLLAAAEKLRDRDDVRFLMVGGGQQKGMLVQEVKRRGLGNVVFRPYQPSELLAESLSVADVHLVSLLPELEYCIVPSKLYGILAAGRPTIFIGDTSGEVASVLQRGSCGETVAPGEGAQLAAAIRRLKENPDACAAMGANARRLFESEYSRANGVARWLAAVDSLMLQPQQVSPRPERVTT